MNLYEPQRLHALKQLNLLNTAPGESFDRITRMASQLFGLPIAAVSLTDTDRQWFKSRVGVDHWEIPRFKACCGEVADTSGNLVIPDLLASPYYRDSNLAQSGIRFYAGAPLTTRDGFTLGAMCVLGTEPRTVTDQEMTLLQVLAAMVMDQIELQHAYGRIDALTGLPNRSQMNDDIQDMSRQLGLRPAYIMFSELVDVTSMGSLQRVMGPAYFEELCRSASRLLSEHNPEGARLYHIGPGQFAHLAFADNDTQMLLLASTLRGLLQTLTTGEAVAVMVRPVVGVAPLASEGYPASDIVRIAHSACLDARLNEHGVALYSSKLDADHQRHFQILLDFRIALEQAGQLSLEYQPRVSGASGLAIGAEALIRWRHPTWGNVPPDEFIPVIEQTQLAKPLTAWVMRSAVAQAGVWHKQGKALCISINISAANLSEFDLANRLLQMMAEQGLPVSAIELELTESALINDSALASKQLTILMEAGIRVVIDDFGTGYSSLAYLQEIPAQVVKIDRSFIQRIALEKRSRTLVKAMIGMAQDLGYEVVAEGVEDSQTWAFLKNLGCDQVQGYLVSRPLTADYFEQWLDAELPID